MKFRILMLPALLILTTSCGTIERMNCLVNQSTQSIHCNRMAVERSSEVIRDNGQLIDQSNEVLEQNRRALEKM